MDHPLRTISYIADIGNMVVLMARRKLIRSRSAQDQDSAVAQHSTPAEDEQQQYRMICHVFESEDVSVSSVSHSVPQSEDRCGSSEFKTKLQKSKWSFKGIWGLHFFPVLSCFLNLLPLFFLSSPLLHRLSSSLSPSVSPSAWRIRSSCGRTVSTPRT